MHVFFRRSAGRWRGLTLICGLLVDAGGARAQVRLVAATGQTIPGVSGSPLTSLSLAGINELGMTALIAESADGQHVLVEHDGAFRTVANQGDAAPGAPSGFAFDGFPFAVLNDAGQVALVGNYSPDGSGRFLGQGYSGPGFAVWSESGGTLQPVVLRDAPMPGAMGGGAGSALFRRISVPTFNAAGETALLSRNLLCDSVGSNTCFECVVLHDGQQLAKVAITGDAAPGVGEEFFTFPFYTEIDFSSGDLAMALNDGGEAAFVASTVGGELWLASGGAVAPVIVNGRQAPGLPAGALFGGSAFTVAMNNGGQIAVRWSLALGGGVTQANRGAVWTGDADGVRLVARQGDAAPGAGTVFENMSDPLINSAGDVLFWGQAEGATGVWRDAGGVLGLVALSGQAAPELPAGCVFESFYDLMINGQGQVALLAKLMEGEGGVTDANDLGIWAQTTAGAWRLVAREGEAYDVDPGPGVDMRTFETLAIQRNILFAGGGSGNEDGRPSYFNDRGQIGFWAGFADGGSGVFVSDLAAVPEPVGWAVWGWIGIGGVMLRRRG
jgi:hypothetical protein